MNIRELALVALVALMASAPAQAGESSAYFGFKAGLMDPQASGHKDTLNVGALIGYQIFDEPQGSGAFEAEATGSLARGKIKGDGDWTVNTYGVYFAYRTPTTVYLKAKGGVYNQQINPANDIADRTGFNYGVGFGWRASRNAGVEAEFTEFHDINYVSFGFYSFF